MHEHHHPHTDVTDRAFALGFVLNAGFVVAEAAFGIIAGSLALVADAGHNLGDVLGVLVAWTAVRLAKRAPTLRRTYGLRRGTVLAALLNSLLLMVAVGVILWEAVGRFREPEPVTAGVVMWVAAVGVLINTATALLFVKGRHTDLNMRAVFVHMSADAAISVGVVVVGVIIRLTGAMWVDPAASIVIGVLIAVTTWGVLRESLNLALDAAPAHIDVEGVQAYLNGLPGVTAVHDLHVWSLSTTEAALTAHLLKPEPEGDDALLAKICCDLQERFSIPHVTIQWERGDDSYVCRQGSGRCL